jgi:hypothetical protein
VVAQSLVRILANRGQKQGLSLGNKLATNVTIQGSQIVDSQSLAKAKKMIQNISRFHELNTLINYA